MLAPAHWVAAAGRVRAYMFAERAGPAQSKMSAGSVLEWLALSESLSLSELAGGVSYYLAGP